MDIEIRLEGQDAKKEMFSSLSDWIQKERIEKLTLKKPKITTEEDKMGGTAETILSIILSSAAIVQLIKSIQIWIKARRPKVNIKIKLKENSKEGDITLNYENVDINPSEIVSKFLNRQK